MSKKLVVSKRNTRAKSTMNKALLYIILTIGGLIMIMPFIWMLSTSLKSEGAIFVMPPKWIPDKFLWSNYAKAIEQAQLIEGLKNTLIIVIPSLVVGLFSCSLAAFSFAKIKFPGREKLFLTLLSTMMIPGIVTMIPSYVLFKKIGWIDTFLPLMVPGMFGGAACIFFLRQFFKTIPDELMEAAELDGLGQFGIFIRIMLPLSKPAIATQAIFGFLGGYNDYMGPLIYLNSTEKFTLQLKLSSFSGGYAAQWALLMAGSVLALIPTILIFFFAQKYFIEGITMTGLKG